MMRAICQQPSAMCILRWIWSRYHQSVNADGCWQIARIIYHEGQNDMYYDFKEIRPNLFVLSHGTAKLFLDKKKWPKGYISMKMDYSYR